MVMLWLSFSKRKLVLFVFLNVFMRSRKFYMMDHLKTQPKGIKNTALTGRVLSLGSRLRAWMPSLAAVWWLKYWKHRSVARPENWLQLLRRDFQPPGSNKGTLKMTQMRLVCWEPCLTKDSQMCRRLAFIIACSLTCSLCSFWKY